MTTDNQTKPGTCPPEAAALLRLYGESQDLDLQQRCHEYAALLQDPGVMVAVLPVDARYVRALFGRGHAWGGTHHRTTT